MKNIRDELQKQFAKELIDLGFYGIMNLACRFGKTKTALNCLSKTDNVLVTYPELSIKNSWMLDVKKFKFNSKKFTYTTFMSFKKIKKA